MQIHDNAIDAIGNTPLIRLSRLHPPGNLVGKIEYLNPAGSIKERIAVNMVDEGLMTRADGVYWRTGGRYELGESGE